MKWYDNLGLSPQEKEIQDKFDKERPKIKQRVNRYILDNGITVITDWKKLVDTILASYPEYTDLSEEDSFIHWGLTYIFVIEWQDSLLEKKRRRSHV
jgi:hypothetical protein